MRPANRGRVGGGTRPDRASRRRTGAGGRSEADRQGDQTRPGPGTTSRVPDRRSHFGLDFVRPALRDDAGIVRKWAAKLLATKKLKLYRPQNQSKREIAQVAPGK